MTKIIYALAAALVLGSTYTLASPGDDGCVGNCSGTGGGSNEQQQTQGQEQLSVNTNRNTNSADSSSNSFSGATAGSSSNATGGSVRNHVGIETGPTTASSTSSATGGAGGSARAYGGTGGVGVGGASDSSSNASNGGNSTGDVTIGGDTSVISYDNDYAASSAAHVFAGECQTGMSGQVESGGFAVVNADQFCQSVKAARVALQAYEWELENGSYTCVDVEYGYVTPEGQDVVVETLQELCINEKAQEYLAAYRHHTDEAISLVRATEDVGLWDAIAGYLVRPVAILSVLIWLI